MLHILLCTCLLTPYTVVWAWCILRWWEDYVSFSQAERWTGARKASGLSFNYIRGGREVSKSAIFLKIYMKRQEIAALLFLDHIGEAGDDLSGLEIATLSWSILALCCLWWIMKEWWNGSCSLPGVQKQRTMAIGKDSPLVWMQGVWAGRYFLNVQLCYCRYSIVLPKVQSIGHTVKYNINNYFYKKNVCMLHLNCPRWF